MSAVLSRSADLRWGPAVALWALAYANGHRPRELYTAGLRYFRGLLGPRVADAWLLYAGREQTRVEGVTLANAVSHFIEN